MTKPNCIFYDWGDTAPREYGAFCRLKSKSLENNTCENCKNYKRRTFTKREKDELIKKTEGHKNAEMVLYLINETVEWTEKLKEMVHEEQERKENLLQKLEKIVGGNDYD